MELFRGTNAPVWSLGCKLELQSKCLWLRSGSQVTSVKHSTDVTVGAVGAWPGTIPCSSAWFCGSLDQAHHQRATFGLENHLPGVLETFPLHPSLEPLIEEIESPGGQPGLQEAEVVVNEACRSDFL